MVMIVVIVAVAVAVPKSAVPWPEDEGEAINGRSEEVISVMSG
jgi:hypothetical protein